MYYHILITTDDNGSLYETDKEDYEYIIHYIIIPYIKEEPFVFNGYLINPFKVKRFKISQSEKDSEDCLQEEKEYMELTKEFHPITKEYCVMEMSDYSNDITSKAIEEAKKIIGPKPPDSSSPAPNSIFLAYSYIKKDEVLAEGFKKLLISRGFEVIDGKADKLGSISEIIMDKIRKTSTFIVIMTKRDKKTNNKYTTSSWLLDEKGAALALDKQVVMMVEENVDERDIGGLQGDIQRFDFNRSNFYDIALTLIKILERNIAVENTSGEERSKA